MLSLLSACRLTLFVHSFNFAISTIPSATSEMLVLQPMRVPTRATMNDATSTQFHPTTPPPFYHRIPPPTQEELQFFGLQAATPVQSEGIRCSICQGCPEDPVLSRCNHIFCFGCVYQWFGRSAFCPKCTRDLYQPRKLRGQPSREIHPAERPGRLSTSQWTKALNTATSKVQSRRNSVEHKVLVKKTRHIAYLQVPQTSHPHTQSDRANSATYKQRTPPHASNSSRKGHTRRHSSLPTYGKSDNQPCKTDYSDKGPPVVIVHQEDHSINDVENLDTAMVDLISTCSKYLEREQQAVSVRVIHLNSEEILSNMWAASASLRLDLCVPIRCRAIAKCVWREWEDYLRRREGNLLMAQELFWGLHRNFERTVVEYGWVDDWTELPNDFVVLLEQTMAAAVPS